MYPPNPAGSRPAAAGVAILLCDQLQSALDQLSHFVIGAQAFPTSEWCVPI